MSLIDTATATFTKQPFVSLLFTSFERMQSIHLPTATFAVERGHVYVFYNAVLKTRLGLTAQTTAHKTCGENGGLTVKGALCKKPAAINGRCAQHPGSRYRCCFDVGVVIPELHLILGDDARLRPLPATVAWKDARVRIDGEEYALIDLQSATFEFVPMAIVWNELLCSIKDMIGLPAEMHVTVNGQLLAADLLWSVENFIARHRLQGTTLRMQDVVLQPGYLLGDYYLKPNAILNM